MHTTFQYRVMCVCEIPVYNRVHRAKYRQHLLSTYYVPDVVLSILHPVRRKGALLPSVQFALVCWKDRHQENTQSASNFTCHLCPEGKEPHSGRIDTKIWPQNTGIQEGIFLCVEGETAELKLEDEQALTTRTSQGGHSGRGNCMS